MIGFCIEDASACQGLPDCVLSSIVRWKDFGVVIVHIVAHILLSVTSMLFQAVYIAVTGA